MQLINCEVSIFLTRLWTCVITNSTGEERFIITDTKLYAPVVTLSTQDIQNYFSNESLVLKKQLTGTNINQIQNHMHKTDT